MTSSEQNKMSTSMSMSTTKPHSTTTSSQVSMSAYPASAVHANNSNSNAAAAAAVDEHEGFVSSWLHYAVNEYSELKLKVKDNKNVPPIVGSSWDKIESFAESAVETAKKNSPVSLPVSFDATLVKSLDDKVDSWVASARGRREDAVKRLQDAKAYYDSVRNDHMGTPSEMKKEAYKRIHDALQHLKTVEGEVNVAEQMQNSKRGQGTQGAQGESKEQEHSDKEIELRGLIADAREVAWYGVEGVRSGRLLNAAQNRLSSGVDAILDQSEQTLDKVLPKSDEEVHDEIIDASTSPQRGSNSSSSDSSSQRVTTTAASSSSQSSSANLDRVYRVMDLSKCATKRLQRRALSQLTGLKTRTEDVLQIDLKRYSERVINPVMDKSAPLVEATKSQISDLVALAKQYQAVAAERVKQSYSGSHDYLLSNYRYFTQHVQEAAQPRIDALKQQFEEFKVKAREQNNDPNQPLTVEAGVRAVVQATRSRAELEWSRTVLPFLERVRAATRDIVGGSNREKASAQ